jgi:hypothetical protein
MPPTVSSLRTNARDSPTRSALARPPGSSALPFNETPPPSRGPESALSFDALTAIASGLAWAEEPVSGGADDPNARSTRLIATALYDVWLITWPSGSSIGPHDHGGARSVLQVVEGELTETFSDQPEDGRSERACSERATPRVENHPFCTNWSMTRAPRRRAFTCTLPRFRTSRCSPGSAATSKGEPSSSSGTHGPVALTMCSCVILILRAPNTFRSAHWRVWHRSSEVVPLRSAPRNRRENRRTPRPAREGRRSRVTSRCSEKTSATSRTGRRAFWPASKQVHP